MNEFTSCLEITQILIELSRGLSISCIDEFQDNKLWEWLVISLKWNESAATKYILQGFSKITFDYEIEETLGEEAII